MGGFFGLQHPCRGIVPGSKTLGSSASVAAAHEGLLSGSKLFVAGTVPPALPGGSPQGTVQTVDTGTLTAGARRARGQSSLSASARTAAASSFVLMLTA